MAANRMGMALGVILLVLPGSAQAASVIFSGSIQNVTRPGVPGGRCGPAPALTLNFSPTNLSASGQSNLGSFTYEASHCVTPTPPVTHYGDGLFKFTFEDGAALEGTYIGTLTFGPSVRTVQDYVVTGGRAASLVRPAPSVTTAVSCLGRAASPRGRRCLAGRSQPCRSRRPGQ